jgi:hypothetical protein
MLKIHQIMSLDLQLFGALDPLCVVNRGRGSGRRPSLLSLPLRDYSGKV